MPKLTHAVPKYRKHRASGQAVVTIYGRDHYLGPHGTKTSKVEYDRLIAEFLAAGRRPTPSVVDSPETTVVEILSGYWKHAQDYYRKNGKPTSEIEGVRSTLHGIKAEFAQLPAMQFGPLALKHLRENWISHPAVAGSPSRSKCPKPPNVPHCAR